eukprot:146080-Rhodomonas_salina.1
MRVVPSFLCAWYLASDARARHVRYSHRLVPGFLCTVLTQTMLVPALEYQEESGHTHARVSCPICLRTGYAMPGTDQGNGTTHCPSLYRDGHTLH